MATSEQHQEMRARSYFVPPASDDCIEANVTRCGHNDRWTVSAGNLDPVNPTLAAAVADGRIIETEDDCGTVCYAPAKGDGLTAEIFRLWVHLREDVARPARFSVTNAATAPPGAAAPSSSTPRGGLRRGVRVGHRRRGRYRGAAHRARDMGH